MPLKHAPHEAFFEATDKPQNDYAVMDDDPRGTL